MTQLPSALLGAPIAHRGFHDKSEGRVENSLSAVKAAVAAGYGVEVDLQASRDGVAMVFHDDLLDRLTAESGPVTARSFSELQAITLSGGTDTIFSLKQVLDVVQGKVPMLIELKDQHGEMQDTDGTLERATAAALEAYTGDVALMSFNPHMVHRLGALCPRVARGLVTSAFRKIDEPHVPVDTRVRLAGIPDFDRVGASFISHDVDNLASPRVEQLKSAGVPALCWTVRSAAQEHIARKVADNITFEGYAA